MSVYKCYFLTSKNHIADRQEIEAPADAEAVRQARALVADRLYCAAEVWERSRLVARHVFPTYSAR
ncbi:MAG: hypothetical protein QOD89_3100 [Bradyrhizobium sp.]|jgi:hypothetical protein|nr:hypothetical protein [Bradyrhizobium sp.]